MEPTNRQPRRTRRTPALLVATVALIAAAGGVALADPGPVARTSLSGNQAKQIAKKQAKRQAKKEIAKKLPIGSKNLGTGAVTATKLGPITKVSATTTIQPLTTGSSTASCPQGSTLLSGGYEQDTSVATGWLGMAHANDSRRAQNGWRTEAAGGLLAPVQWTTNAYCLD